MTGMRVHPWLRTILSLALYISIYYLLFRDLRSISLLVAVIVLHESGHYVAMRLFGYSNVRMLFIPMLGAFVSGRPATVHPAKKLIVLFAGPLPGIVIGMICAMIYLRGHQHLFYQLALMFLFLNVFNLIPLTPMDGGQILETLFIGANKWLQSIFIVLSAIVLGYLMTLTRNYILILLLVLLASRLFRLWRKEEEGDEKETEPQVELSLKEKLVFVSIWLLAMIIPMQTLYRLI